MKRLNETDSDFIFFEANRLSLFSKSSPLFLKTNKRAVIQECNKTIGAMLLCSPFTPLARCHDRDAKETSKNTLNKNVSA